MTDAHVMLWPCGLEICVLTHVGFCVVIGNYDNLLAFVYLIVFLIFCRLNTLGYVSLTNFVMGFHSPVS